MATGRDWAAAAGWRCSHPHDCHPPTLPQQPQTAGRGASDLLRSYIERFDRTGDPACARLNFAGGPPQSSAPASPRLPQLPPMEDDRDTLELLCGGGGHGGSRLAASSAAQAAAAAAAAAALDEHVSVRTRRILRDVDKQLGHSQPCYSAPDKLDLRTMWPNMHEHLDRRWRQQLRARYEAKLREEVDAAAAAKAAQGSRADMYSWAGGGRHRGLRATTATVAALPSAKRPPPERKVETRAVVESKSNSGEEDEEAVSDAEVNLAEAAVHSEESDEEETEEEEDEEEEEAGGRPWGSDSGLGFSSVAGGGGGGEKQLRSTAQPEKPRAAPAKPADSALAGLEEAAAAGDDDDKRSFEERMRSYRCVLEAHELSAQLRQRLEVACAAGGSPRALTADQKGHIRDRLARLQHPEQLDESLSQTSPVKDEDQGKQLEHQEHQEHQERITTERLTRLMHSARSLLADGAGDGRDRRLSDSLQAAQQQLQRQQQHGSPTDGNS